MGRGKKVLMELPVGEWIEIAVSARLGGEAGKWNLKVGRSGKDDSIFEDLPVGNPDWNRLDWLGFVSQADADTEVWIDDLELHSDS